MDPKGQRFRHAPAANSSTMATLPLDPLTLLEADFFQRNDRHCRNNCPSGQGSLCNDPDKRRQILLLSEWIARVARASR
jgi:hypothetical protein